MISFGAFLEPGDVVTGGDDVEAQLREQFGRSYYGPGDASPAAFVVEQRRRELSSSSAAPAAGAVAGLGAATPAAPAPGRADSLTAAPSVHELPAGWARLGYAVAVGLVLIVLILAVRKW